MDKPTNIKRTPVPAIQPKPTIPEPPTLEAKLLTEILAELKKQNRTSSLSDSRWLNTNQAAAWCGGVSVDHFRKLAKRYNIPRHGARRLFDKFELDEWVLDPRCFLESNSPSLRRGRSNSMAAIQNLIWALKDLQEKEKPW